jgi:two-component system, NtrC family, sensor kinase
LAGLDRKGTSDYADEVTLSRKGAKSRTRIPGLRSTRTKATAYDARIDDLEKKLAEALEQQTATSEVLRVISRSPGDLVPVFETILALATRICEAKFGSLYLYDGKNYRTAAQHNPPPALAELRRQKPVFRAGPGTGLGRAAAAKQVVHIADLSAEQAYIDRDPLRVDGVELIGARTALFVPMLKENTVIGTMTIFRQQVRPFTDRHIELVTNFAAQAVIAIENTRLLNELRESLQQQTATADVLQVISSSPGELQPVFDAMLANVTRLCEAKFASLLLSEGDEFRRVSLHNAPPALTEHWRRTPLVSPHPESAVGRASLTKQMVHIDDIKASQAYRDRDPILVAGVELGGYRTVLSVPMLKDQEVVGLIVIYRQEVRPFTGKQIELVDNFAKQAVIAIENTRLLNELRQRTDDLSEALDQQTATSDVLKVISGSPGDLEPVFQAVLGNATQLCEAKYGTLWLTEGDAFRTVASHGDLPRADFEPWQRGNFYSPGPDVPLGRVAKTRQPVHVSDMREDPSYLRGDKLPVAAVDRAGVRTLFVVPMLRENDLVGAIAIYRTEVRPFSNKQVELVTNFAAQAVIAIENTRLLNELRQRTDDLSEALEQQTATSEVLRVISQFAGRT